MAKPKWISASAAVDRFHDLTPVAARELLVRRARAGKLRATANHFRRVWEMDPFKQSAAQYVRLHLDHPGVPFPPFPPVPAPVIEEATDHLLPSDFFIDGFAQQGQREEGATRLDVDWTTGDFEAVQLIGGDAECPEARLTLSASGIQFDAGMIDAIAGPPMVPVTRKSKPGPQPTYDWGVPAARRPR